MEYVSFRRAKHFPQMILPPELIVQWEFGVVPDIESLPEDDFRIEFAKNEDILRIWLEARSSLEIAKANAAKWSAVVSNQERKLFEEFKAKRGKK